MPPITVATTGSPTHSTRSSRPSTGWSTPWPTSSTSGPVTPDPGHPTFTKTVTRLIGGRVHGLEPVAGGDICAAYRVGLSGGRTVFAKSRSNAPSTFFAVEARGLTRLAEVDGGAPTPAVVAYNADCLVLEWVEPGPPTASAAEQLGRALARTHRAG